MLGRMRFKNDKKPTTKPKLNQTPKTPKKQDARQVAKKQIMNKPMVKVTQSPNPYRRFLDSNKSASIEDLTKYFELRTSRFNARSVAVAAAGLSLFALLVTAYYQAIEKVMNFDGILLGYVVLGVLVGAAISLMVFLWKHFIAMSDSNFDKNFGWYLDAKSRFGKSQQPQNMEANELTPKPIQVGEVQAIEETEVVEESNNLEDSDEIQRFLTELEKAAGS